MLRQGEDEHGEIANTPQGTAGNRRCQEAGLRTVPWSSAAQLHIPLQG